MVGRGKRYVNMTVLYEKRKRVYGNTSLCSIFVANTWMHI